MIGNDTYFSSQLCVNNPCREIINSIAGVEQQFSVKKMNVNDLGGW